MPPPSRAQALALQRERLCARSAALRSAIAHDARALATPLALGDQARGAWSWLKAHPQWPLGAVALVVVVRPRRAVRLALRAWGAWQLWRRVRAVVLPLWRKAG